MPSDFRDASTRHLLDAQLLEVEGRLANADHLFGVSAECSLKAIMIELGHSADAVGAPEGHRDHINELLPKFEVWADGLLDAKHLGMMPASDTFSGWDVAQRYWPESDARFATGNVAILAAGARQCRDVLNELFLDGILQ